MRAMITESRTERYTGLLFEAEQTLASSLTNAGATYTSTISRALRLYDNYVQISRERRFSFTNHAGQRAWQSDAERLKLTLGIFCNAFAVFLTDRQEIFPEQAEALAAALERQREAYELALNEFADGARRSWRSADDFAVAYRQAEDIYLTAVGAATQQMFQARREIAPADAYFAALERAWVEVYGS